MRCLFGFDYLWCLVLAILLFSVCLGVDLSLGFVHWVITSFANNADVTHKALTCIVIVVGGVSAYLKFFMGQTLASRLELKVEHEIVEINNFEFIKIRVEAKNLGTTSFYFGDGRFNSHPKFSTYKNYRLRWKRLVNRRKKGRKWKFRTLAGASVRRGYISVPKSRFTVTEWNEKVLAPDGKPYPEWQPIKLKLFRGHQWIRANEVIVDELFVGLAAPLPAICQINVEVISKSRPFRTEGDIWRTVSTFHIPPKEEKSEEPPLIIT